VKPVFGTRFLDKKYLHRKGAYAIILSTAKDKVLTVHNGKGLHFLPGGGIEEGENDLECLKREMLEETGYRAKIDTFIGSALNYFFSSENEPIVSDGNFYLAQLLDKVQEPSEDDHLLEWVHIEIMEDFFFYQHQVWAVKKALKQS
jgi:8-oxo-dGTP diphosphatase